MATKVTDNRVAAAWYVRYPLDAYAMGPFRYSDPVQADVAVESAEKAFGNKPCEVWPEGRTAEVDEYEYEVFDPDAEDED